MQTGLGEKKKEKKRGRKPSAMAEISLRESGEVLQGLRRSVKEAASSGPLQAPRRTPVLNAKTHLSVIAEERQPIWLDAEQTPEKTTISLRCLQVFTLCRLFNLNLSPSLKPSSVNIWFVSLQQTNKSSFTPL